MVRSCVETVAQTGDLSNQVALYDSVCEVAKDGVSIQIFTLLFHVLGVASASSNRRSRRRAAHWWQMCSHTNWQKGSVAWCAQT